MFLAAGNEFFMPNCQWKDPDKWKLWKNIPSTNIQEHGKNISGNYEVKKMN